MDDFFSPPGIHFTRRTILWLLHNLRELREGNWPSEMSNYIDLPIGKGSGKSPFETPLGYAIEIEQRLEECRIDGLILLAIECWELTEASLSSYFNFPIWDIRKRWKNALNYISSGLNRRWFGEGCITYKEWENGKRWNKKKKEYYWKKGRK